MLNSSIVSVIAAGRPDGGGAGHRRAHVPLVRGVHRGDADLPRRCRCCSASRSPGWSGWRSAGGWRAVRSLSAGDLAFLVLAMRWTVVLSAGAFLFGGLVGVAVALARVSERGRCAGRRSATSGCSRARRCCCSFSWCSSAPTCSASASAPYLSAILGLSLNAGAFLGEIWRGALQAVPRGPDRRRRGRSACATVPRMLRVVGPAGAADRHPADGRLPGQPGEEHVAGRHHRLRGADPGRADAEQRDLPPVHHLRHCRPALLPALLAADDRQPPPRAAAGAGARAIRYKAGTTDEALDDGPPRRSCWCSAGCAARRRGRRRWTRSSAAARSTSACWWTCRPTDC